MIKDSAKELHHTRNTMNAFLNHYRFKVTKHVFRSSHQKSLHVYSTSWEFFNYLPANKTCQKVTDPLTQRRPGRFLPPSIPFRHMCHIRCPTLTVVRCCQRSKVPPLVKCLPHVRKIAQSLRVRGWWKVFHFVETMLVKKLPSVRHGVL